jgi:hypothetical protein
LAESSPRLNKELPTHSEVTVSNMASKWSNLRVARESTKPLGLKVSEKVIEKKIVKIET